MKKTLSKKVIGGRDYYYLAYRVKGKLVNKYLGPIESTQYKKYLLKLTEAGATYGIDKAKRRNFAAGAPVAYVEGGFLVLEYRNGAKELLDSKGTLRRLVKKND